MRDDPTRYALEHAHYVEDLDFWRAAAAAAGGPVLDLGCAAGRVAVPLARDGARVWALDASPGMLDALMEAARQAGVADRVTPVVGDMRAFAVDVRFRLAIAAMNTLQTLLTPDDQLRCLRCVRAHLADGADLVFDVSLPDLGEIRELIGVVRRTGEHRDPRTGALLLHSSWYDDVDAITQTVTFTIQVDEIAAGGEVTRHLRRHEVHVYVPSELHHLLARAGFDVVDVLGDFAGGPVDAASERQIYRCRAA
ncbi:MAG: class I SAM-dependent methyltransferase [Actinomycetota bacterium]